MCVRIDPPPTWESGLYIASIEGNKTKFLAIIRQYEYSGDPDMLSYAAQVYSAGSGEFESEDAREQKIVEYLKKAALCGQRRALYLLAEGYDQGKHGLAPYPQMAQCLRRMLKANQNAVGCKLTLDEDRMPEPSEVPRPNSTPIPGP